MTDRQISLNAAIAVVQDNLAFSVKAQIVKALSSLPNVDGWLDIESAPHAMTVAACRFDESIGEWVYAYVLSPPSFPFTHWQPLPAPPAEK